MNILLKKPKQKINSKLFLKKINNKKNILLDKNQLIDNNSSNLFSTKEKIIINKNLIFFFNYQLIDFYFYKKNPKIIYIYLNQIYTFLLKNNKYIISRIINSNKNRHVLILFFGLIFVLKYDIFLKKTKNEVFLKKHFKSYKLLGFKLFKNDIVYLSRTMYINKYKN